MQQLSLTRHPDEYIPPPVARAKRRRKSEDGLGLEKKRNVKPRTGDGFAADLLLQSSKLLDTESLNSQSSQDEDMDPAYDASKIKLQLSIVQGADAAQNKQILLAHDATLVQLLKIFGQIIQAKQVNFLEWKQETANVPMDRTIGIESIEYQDEENEWLKIECEADLELCLSMIETLHRTKLFMHIVCKNV